MVGPACPVPGLSRPRYVHVVYVHVARAVVALQVDGPAAVAPDGVVNQEEVGQAVQAAAQAMRRPSACIKKGD